MDNENIIERSNPYNGVGSPMVEYENKLYFVKFIHDIEYKDIKNGNEVFGRTEAYILDGDNKIVFTNAYCSKYEAYNKREGRAKSAGRLFSKICKSKRHLKD